MTISKDTTGQVVTQLDRKTVKVLSLCASPAMDRAIAEAGFIVVSVSHKDAVLEPTLSVAVMGARTCLGQSLEWWLGYLEALGIPVIGLGIARFDLQGLLASVSNVEELREALSILLPALEAGGLPDGSWVEAVAALQLKYPPSGRLLV